ncbi:protein of unknown function (plasmid) [Azospirillum lipoferum 4B]|uniref:Uncharacterized protein n=1 Tax=Azospirillum lipoferum (strain 4B) TaxID=862719 RepID=G7ZEF8_AZOL4|nr:protein of unknown function [Azospirillum lipoferum 4B]
MYHDKFCRKKPVEYHVHSSTLNDIYLHVLMISNLFFYRLQNTCYFREIIATNFHGISDKQRFRQLHAKPNCHKYQYCIYAYKYKECFVIKTHVSNP